MIMMSLNGLILIKKIKIIPTTVLAILRSIIITTKLVFSRWPYVVLTGAVAAIFWIIFNVFDQLLFFSPVATFYLPDDAVQGFILSNIIAILVGLVISTNPFVIRHSKGLKTGILSLFKGSTMSIRSSTCASWDFFSYLLSVG